MLIYSGSQETQSKIRVWRSLVSRLNGVQEASSSNLDTRTMQSVLIGSEYPVMDTLLFYVENGETPEMSLLTRSRRHNSLTLCVALAVRSRLRAVARLCGDRLGKDILLVEQHLKIILYLVNGELALMERR